MDSHSSGLRVAAQLKRPTRKPMWATCSGQKAPLASLFGLAPGGVCRAEDVATRAVRSYRTLSPLPAPLARHLGGLLSVALSVGSRLPGVTWHPALWSPDFPPCDYSHSDCLADSEVHHTQVRPLLRAELIFQRQGAFIGKIVANAGDLCGKTRGLFEGQLRQQGL